jgi:hypothetical protein
MQRTHIPWSHPSTCISTPCALAARPALQRVLQEQTIRQAQEDGATAEQVIYNVSTRALHIPGLRHRAGRNPDLTAGCRADGELAKREVCHFTATRSVRGALQACPSVRWQMSDVSL